MSNPLGIPHGYRKDVRETYRITTTIAKAIVPIIVGTSAGILAPLILSLPNELPTGNSVEAIVSVGAISLFQLVKNFIKNKNRDGHPLRRFRRK